MLSSGLLQICKQQHSMIVGLSMKKFRIYLCKVYFIFKYEKEITIPGNLFTFFMAIISLISSFRSFYRRKRHISLSFHILHLLKSLPFHTSEAWKRYPFWAEPLRIGHYRDYPPRAKRQVNTRRETKGHSIFL